MLNMLKKEYRILQTGMLAYYVAINICIYVYICLYVCNDVYPIIYIYIYFDDDSKYASGLPRAFEVRFFIHIESVL